MSIQLNPAFYQALRARFGEVRIANPGQQRIVRQLAGGGFEAEQRGEQYRVDCPFCKDQRKRLYVSYAFGLHDPENRRPNFSLWFCQNEQCHRQQNNRDLFRQMTALPLGRRLRQPAAQPNVASPTTSAPLQPQGIALPLNLAPVPSLPPEHPVWQYLLRRGFDPKQLGAERELYYSSFFSSEASHRLVMPVYMPANPRLEDISIATNESVLAGWQARLIEPADEHAPKYIFPIGMRKSDLLYGLPAALKTSGPVVICEGATDCWRVGPHAVALFGKQASSRQIARLIEHFRGRPIVVLLDSDALENAFALATVLLRAGAQRVEVAPLPIGRKDPAECSPEEITALIHHALNS